MTTHWRALGASLALLAVPLSAAIPAAAAAPPTTRTTRAAATKAPFPAVTVTDVRTGRPTDLRDFNTTGKPMLVWFWAPHRVVCNAEAREIEQFARQHKKDVVVIGLGTQDDLASAKQFRARHDVQQTKLYWDAGFDSWRHFGVRVQPAGVLLDAKGRMLGRWPLIELDEVEKLL